VHIAAVSYGLATVAFALLTALFLASWRGKLQGALLATAAAVTTLWAGVCTYAVVGGAVVPVGINALELARATLWLAFVFKLLQARAEQSGVGQKALFQRVFLGGLAAVGLLFVLTLAFALAPPHLVPTWAPRFTLFGHILLAVTGLVLIEQLYRNATDSQRWALKYFCLGLGALFAYDFYLFSDALLLGRLDPSAFSARGIANAVIVPLLAVAAARNPEWSLDVFVSRRMVFHSATLLGAGVYLLLMAAAGYYIRLFGGTWGGVLQSAFFFGALVVLVALIFSGAVRAKLKVFLNKHFFNYKYDYREEWLHFTRTLSEGEPGVAVRERSLRAVAALVESPAAALWMREEGGPFVQVAHWNHPIVVEPEPAGGVLSSFLRERQWVISVPEYELHGDIYGDLVLPGWFKALPNAWLIVPLMMHEELIGFMVLSRPRSERGFNWEDSDLLKTAGRQVAVHLAQIQAMEALAQSRQFESFNRFSAFVVHDLKNVVAQLSLILANAEKHKHKPEFQQDMLATVDHATQKMNRLLSQLRAGYQTAQGAGLVNLVDLLAGVVREKGCHQPVPTLEHDGETLWVLADRERLARVLGHLVQNGIEATPETGSVRVLLEADGERARIEVRDTGKGMDQGFIRDHLFRPFSSTKPAGMGIGVYECREYVRELKGDIQVYSRPTEGTVFTVSLPTHARRSEDKEEIRMRGTIGG
jgi:putative PEP-CTERM system histidine kinase